MGKGEEIRKHEFIIAEQSQGCEVQRGAYSPQHGNNCLGSEGNQMYQSEGLVSYVSDSSLCCTPETNVILFVKCN